MKKRFVYYIFAFFTFFFFSCFDLKASTINEDLDLDAHNHFNFYYEAVHNTDFYRFVNGKGSTFESYLSSYGIPTDFIYFSYALDFNWFGLDYIPENAYYVIAGSNVPSSIKYLDGYYSINLKADSSNWSAQYSEGYLVFDKNMNLLDKFISPKSSNYKQLSSIGFEKFVYISGSIYKGSPAVIGFDNVLNSNIRYTSLIVNESTFNIKGLTTRSGWANFWSGVWNIISLSFDSSIDLNDFGLSFFTTNFAYKFTGYNGSENFGSIYDVLYYDPYFYSNLSVPDGYVSSTFNYSNRKLLIPKVLNISNVDSLLYFSSSDVSGINFISYDILEDSLSYNNLQTYSFTLHKANYIEAISLKNIIDNLVSDNYYVIYSSDNFNTNSIYYNPDVFYIFDLLDSENISFVNPNSNNEVTLSPAERQIFNKHLDELNSTIDPSDDINSDYTNISVSDIFSSAWNGAKTFIQASYYIVGMVSNLFISLPASVSSLILCVFTVGMVAVLWKIFH